MLSAPLEELDPTVNEILQKVRLVSMHNRNTEAETV